MTQQQVKKLEFSQDRIRIIEDYTDQLYSTHGFDINIVDQIPSSEPMNEQLPTPAEIQEAMQKVKSRRASRDVRANSESDPLQPCILPWY